MISGGAVALSIALGAFVVFDRACRDTVAAEHEHLGELAVRVAAIGRGFHRAIVSGENADRARNMLLESTKFICRNDAHVRRIFSFREAETGGEMLVDTGERTDLPDAGRRAIAHYRSKPGGDWWADGKFEATGFAPIRDGERTIGFIGVENNVDHLYVRIDSIRNSLRLTCLAGLLLGLTTGTVVWKTRSRTAREHREFEEARQIEYATFASLGEVVYCLDILEGIFQWRANTRELLGFDPPAEGQPKNEWISRVHPDDQMLYIAALREAVSSEKASEVEYRIRRGNETVWLLDRSRAVTLPDDRRILVGSLIDITARKNAEESLRLFFEETVMAHMIFEGDMIIAANPAAAYLLGESSTARLIKRPVAAFWPKRQRSNEISGSAWAERVKETASAGSTHFEWTFSRANGDGVDCDVFLRSVTLQDRPVMLMACYDITRAKRAQLQLIESEKRFRDISEAIGEFIWEVDPAGRYVYVSPRVRDIFGVGPEDVIGQNPIDWVPESDRASFAERSGAIVAEAAVFRGFEHRVLRPDGRILWVSVSGVPKFDAEGNLAGFRGAVLDITQHRTHEEQLMLQKNAAEAADLAKSRFLAMMSHEIRTPLNSVLGFADLMLDTPLTPVQRDYLSTIKRSGDTLLVVLNDVLDFTKIESGRMEVELRPTDLFACIREVLEMYKPSAASRELDLAARFENGVPQWIRTDPARLRQILINLVGNAVKFTEQGSVTVKAGLTAGRIRIAVADTGIGISPEQRKRLFKPFSQADSSTTRRFGGTGLGLVISQRLAELLGGKLELANTGAGGSEFVIEIPAEPAAPGVTPAPAKPDFHLQPAPEEARPIRVLVVDDNALNLRLTSLLLGQLGADAQSAQSAGECFARLADDPGFDLILMDVQMPDIDGLEAARRLREDEKRHGRRRIPVVALTANAMVGDRERCLAAGMDDYLSKPLRREALAQVLERFAPAPQA